MKAIKRILITLLSATMLLTAATAVCSAVPAEENITITVTVIGQTVEFPDQKPFLRDDRTLVPIRFIAESLGYEVDWDAKENTALIDGGRIKLRIGTNRAELNGKKVTLDTSSILYNAIEYELTHFDEITDPWEGYAGAQYGMTSLQNGDGTTFNYIQSLYAV